MRVIVEPATARLAAERASGADIEALSAAVDRTASARDLAERDKLVHGSVEDDPVPSHRAMLDAIAARDAEAAYDAMRALVDKSGADLDRLD